MERPQATTGDWQSVTTFNDLSLTELAAVVSEHLKKYDINVAVVGGSAITSHVPEVYTSEDIDFANPSANSLRDIAHALKAIRFERSGRVFVHPDTRYTVDFVADTPRIDQRFIVDFVAIKTQYGCVLVYKLEDAIADRVAAFLRWSDSESLEVAERAVKAARDRLTWQGIEAALRQLNADETKTALRLKLALDRLKKAFDSEA